MHPETNSIRIGIDGGDFHPDEEVRSGISRLLKSFVHHIPERVMKRTDWRYYHFGSARRNKGQRGIPRVVRLPARFFSSLFLPLRMYLDKRSVYLGFSGVLPGLVRLLRMKSIVCIHDLAFYDHPDAYRDPGRMKWQTEYAVYGADRIVVFSDHIRSRVIERFPDVKPDKIVRIYPGCDHLGSSRAGRPEQHPYFLYVGVIKPAKNIGILMHRFHRFLRSGGNPKTRLVLIGSAETEYLAKLRETAVFKAVAGNLVFLREAKDRELASWLEHATALLNVSKEEGFCYPVAEALHAGRRVIVNGLPVYREFSRAYGTVSVCPDEASFVDAMIKAASDKAKGVPPRRDLSTWSAFSENMIEVIQSLSV
jgi:glycosyltransferase involved in cell wall biosynthesis